MLKYFGLKSIRILLFLAMVPLLSMKEEEEQWISLLDQNLSQWDNYLSYRHKDGYNGNVPVDAHGKPIPPIGYNRDETKVFSVQDGIDGPILKISGEIYGSLFTRKSYRNYHLKLQVKWGEKKYEPRKNLLKDSGILYHSIGEAGVEHWRSWMLSQEFQVMEGHMGDFWCQANSAIDIRSFPPEHMMNAVADEKMPFRTFNKDNGNFYCMRSANYESADKEWTTLELICFEGKSLHIVNGEVVMILQNSRYVQDDGKAISMIEGKIQLQSEAAEVYYKNIMIKELSGMPVQYSSLFNRK